MHSPQRIAILGAGISGLAAGYRLHQLAKKLDRPISLSIFEATSRAGGMLQSFRRDGFLLETGPDCFLRSAAKPWGLELCEELGLGPELIGTQEAYRRSFIVRKGKLHPVPEGFYLLAPANISTFWASPILSWQGKLRALAEPFIPMNPQQDESLASFVRRRLGQEVLDRLAQPLLAGIYAADPEQLSLRATFPQFLDMEKTGGVLRGVAQREGQTTNVSGARYSLFASLKNGMQSLTDRCANAIPKEYFHFGKRVHKLERHNNEWILRFSDGTSQSFDSVVSTLPAYANATILSDLDSTLSKELREIPYGDAMTVNIALPLANIHHPHPGLGYVVPAKEHRPVFACTFVHRKFADRVPEGYALLRAFVGGVQLQHMNQTDSQLTDLCWKDLKSLLQIDGEPLFTHTARWHQAMPQFTLGHIDRISRIRRQVAAHPGLALAGNWLDGVGIPDAIATAETTANELIQK